jgi:hypothetical protein
MHEMTKGQKYLVVHKRERQRKNRRSVLVYIEYFALTKEYVFSGRPACGTLTIPDSDIIQIKLVTDSQSCYYGAVV